MRPRTISTFGAGCRHSIPGRLRRKANRPANRIAGALLPRCCPEEEPMSLKNRQVLLALRPKGEPTPENLRLVEAEVPRPGAGQMLLRTVYLSLDPYMRGRMNAAPPTPGRSRSARSW